MESLGKRPGSIISFKQLILLVSLFFIGMITTIVIYYKLFPSEKVSKSEESSGVPSAGASQFGGWFSKSNPPSKKAKSSSEGSESFFLSADREYIKHALERYIELMESGGKVNQDFINLLKKHKGHCSKKTNELIDVMLELSKNMVPGDDIKFYKSLTRLLIANFL